MDVNSEEYKKAMEGIKDAFTPDQIESLKDTINKVGEMAKQSMATINDASSKMNQESRAIFDSFVSPDKIKEQGDKLNEVLEKLRNFS